MKHLLYQALRSFLLQLVLVKQVRLYEPIHGSAPDIANEDKANPFGMVLSLALCLRESLNQIDAANELESIVYSFIQSNKTTADLGGQYRTSEIFKLLKENIYKRRRKLWVKHF